MCVCGRVEEHSNVSGVRGFLIMRHKDKRLKAKDNDEAKHGKDDMVKRQQDEKLRRQKTGL